MDEVLFVIDPNLGARARLLIREHFKTAEPVFWAMGDEAVLARLEATLQTMRHAVALSFYSDYIFPAWALARIDLPLNIHPALPSLPGVGYDWMPLWEGHRTHGATLHRMDVRIDSGEIYDVIERPLAIGCSHAELRARNQELALSMLERWLPAIASAPDPATLLAVLKENAKARGKPVWTGEYCSRRKLALRRERNSPPDQSFVKRAGRRGLSARPAGL